MRKLGSAYLGIITAAVAGTLVGCGDLPAEDSAIGMQKQAIISGSTWLVMPSSGQFWFGLYSTTWAATSGYSTACNETVNSGVNTADPDLSNNGCNDTTQSYALCNNTGASNTFDVILYQDTNYGTVLHENSSLTVLNDSCAIVNMTSGEANKVSSFKLLW